MRTYIDLCIIIDSMPTNIHIEVPDEEQYNRLQRIKDEHGLTWRGMLVHAANDLEPQSGR
jgi:hypothetical protein